MYVGTCTEGKYSLAPLRLDGDSRTSQDRCPDVQSDVTPVLTHRNSAHAASCGGLRDRNPLITWDFPKIGVPYFGGPFNKDPTI